MPKMTVQQYAKLRNVSPVAVTRAMVKGKQLIGVRHYQKVRRDWVLLVLTIEAEKKPKKCIVISK